MKFVILAIFAIFVAQSFHIAGKILLTFAIFSKFADFSKPFLTFSFSKCRILWNSEFQVLNSRFYLRVTWTPHLNCQRESGFQSPGFQISQSKFLRFPKPIYLTWGLYTLLCDNIQFYNNYNKSRNFRVLIARKLLSKTLFRLKASPGLLRPAESVKMESIKKLNNFNFQRAPIRTFSSELFHTTYYIYSP